MASTTLLTSKSKASCTSTWTGTYNIGGSFTYSTPTYVSDRVTVTVPAALVGVTFHSAALTYNYTYSQIGNKAVTFSDTQANVTNASLLKRLQNGDTSFVIAFSFQASGGTGGSGSHNATATWSNISLTVTYTDVDGVTGTVTVTSGGTATYSISTASLAPNETATVSLYLNPTIAITGVTLSLRPGSLTAAQQSYSINKTVSANGSASVSFSVSLASTAVEAMVNRVYTGQARITFHTAGGTDYSSSWTEMVGSDSGIPFHMVKNRVAPVISSISWSENETSHLTAYGSLIQGRTVPVISFAVTLDTAADATVSVGSRSIVIDSKTYTPGENSCLLAAISASGSVPFTVSVTDSCGQTGVYEGTVTVLTYSPPSLTGLGIDRYSSSLDSGGHTVYELDDDGSHLWFDGSISVKTQLGLGINRWSLCINGDNVVENSNTTDVTYTHERSFLTDEYENTVAYDFTVTLSDSFTSQTYEINVPKAGGYLNIETTGVAVGMRSTGTAENPLFQVAYPAELASISKLNGITYDTGWVQFHVGSDFPEQSNLYKRRIGSIVFLCGAVRYTPSLAQSAYVTLLDDIGEGFRPSVAQAMIPLGGDYPGFQLYVDTAGKVQIRNRNGSARANMYFTLNCSYAI